MTIDAMNIVVSVAEWSIAVLELLGIGIIMIFAVYATAYNLYLLIIWGAKEKIFQEYRLQLARGILLGLEFLVAADIIKTVAIELTFSSVGILAVIVIIRTFLSFAIDMEITGKWPWQNQSAS
ncbi:MAG: DUF1622 domain-containing protein [Desulfosalsimonadaceae bacterium]